MPSLFHQVLSSPTVRFGSIALALALVVVDRLWSVYAGATDPKQVQAVAQAKQLARMSLRDLHQSLVANQFELVDAKIDQLQLELPEDPLHWNFGNVVHQTMILNGLLAIYRDADIEKAKGYLVLAGQIPSSPQLESFGPNMLLAELLLVRGEFEIVEHYFDQCAILWPEGAERLASWRDQVRAHQIPDFGPNLDY